MVTSTHGNRKEKVAEVNGLADTNLIVVLIIIAVVNGC